MLSFRLNAALASVAGRCHAPHSAHGLLDDLPRETAQCLRALATSSSDVSLSLKLQRCSPGRKWLAGPRSRRPTDWMQLPAWRSARALARGRHEWLRLELDAAQPGKPPSVRRVHISPTAAGLGPVADCLDALYSGPPALARFHRQVRSDDPGGRLHSSLRGAGVASSGEGPHAPLRRGRSRRFDGFGLAGLAGVFACTEAAAAAQELSLGRQIGPGHDGVNVLVGFRRLADLRRYLDAVRWPGCFFARDGFHYLPEDADGYLLNLEVGSQVRRRISVEPYFSELGLADDRRWRRYLTGLMQDGLCGPQEALALGSFQARAAEGVRSAASARLVIDGGLQVEACLRVEHTARAAVACG